MIVHYHPDGQVYLRNDDWSVIYVGTRSEAEAVLGEPIPGLPDGIKERQLLVGQWCRDFNLKGDQLEGPLDWSIGAKIVNKKNQLEAKHAQNVDDLAKRANAVFINAKEKAEGKQDPIMEPPKPGGGLGK